MFDGERARAAPGWFRQMLQDYDGSLDIAYAVEDYPNPQRGDRWTFQPHWRVIRKVGRARELDPKFYYRQANRRRARNTNRYQSPINQLLEARTGYICVKTHDADMFETGSWAWILPSLWATDVRRFSGWDAYAAMLEEHERYEEEQRDQKMDEDLRQLGNEAWVHAQYQDRERVSLVR